MKKTRLSPCQIHLQRHMAAAMISAAPVGPVAADRPDEGPEAQAYALLREQLGEHIRELKASASLTARIEKKRELLPVYNDHIDTVLLTAEIEGKAVQDEVFVYLTIWHLDAATIDPELYPRAFDMVRHVLKYGLKLPEAEAYRRSPGALFRELVVDAALKAITLADADEPRPFDIETLHQITEITEGSDIGDIITAKLHKALGLLYQRLAKGIDAGKADAPAGGAKAALSEAISHFKRAIAADAKIGVKQAITDSERALAKTERQ